MSTCAVPGIFYGVATATLQGWLAEAQVALHELKTGARGVSYAYTQGDGPKAVTYTAASIPALEDHIRELQKALGVIRHARHPVRFAFR